MIYKKLYAKDIEKEFIAIGRDYFSPSGYLELYDILDEMSGEEGYFLNAFDVTLMFYEVSAHTLVEEHSDYLDEEDYYDDGIPLTEEELAELISDRMQDRGFIRAFIGDEDETRFIIGRDL